MLKKIVLKSIKIYQKTLSLDHGLAGKISSKRVCRFTPTCSEYSYTSIERFGVLKGGWIAIKRIIKCNPFGSSGYDPVPQS